MAGNEQPVAIIKTGGRACVCVCERLVAIIKTGGCACVWLA